MAKKEYTEAQIAKAVAMVKGGATLVEAAHKVGAHHLTVARWVSKATGGAKKGNAKRAAKGSTAPKAQSLPDRVAALRADAERHRALADDLDAQATRLGTEAIAKLREDADALEADLSGRPAAPEIAPEPLAAEAEVEAGVPAEA